MNTMVMSLNNSENVCQATMQQLNLCHCMQLV